MTRSADISPLSVLLSKVDAASDGSPPKETVASGFPSLDTLLGGGFRRSDLVVLGGDAASGKSALALAFAIRAASQGQRVAFLTAEMTVERVLERVIAIESRAKIDDLRQGTLDDMTRASAGAAALRLRDQLPVIDRLSPGQGVSDINAVLDEFPNTDFVVVDSAAALLPGVRSVDEELAGVDTAAQSPGARPGHSHIDDGAAAPADRSG